MYDIIIFLVLSIFTSFDIQSAKNVFCYTNYGKAGYVEEKEEFLKEIFGSEYNVILVTSLKNLRNFEYIITIEVPHKDQELKYLLGYPQEKVLLFTFEGQLCHPRSHDYVYHHYYSKVFTWNDAFIDNKKYFKVLFPWADPIAMIHEVPFSHKKLCVLVASDNRYDHPLENYSGRRNLIDFFEKRHAHDLDFYGLWDTPYKNYKTYKGKISFAERFNFTYSRRINKINAIKDYKFDICYENTKGLYFTERIFDTFAAGCVPVYWGAANIDHYVPRACMIFHENFKNDEELYAYLKNMSEAEYEIYRKNIKHFLTSDAAVGITTNAFIQRIKTILELP